MARNKSAQCVRSPYIRSAASLYAPPASRNEQGPDEGREEEAEAEKEELEAKKTKKEEEDA